LLYIFAGVMLDTAFWPYVGYDYVSCIYL